MSSESNYHVVICGGGLAGLTLALQLRKRHSEINISVIEKTTRPLPEAAHKVGESTVEIGGHYLSTDLGLKKYLEQQHLPKLGLRYFYNNSAEHFEDRPELGPSMFSPVPTYQLDRGILENDLREMVSDSGAELLEGATLNEIEIAENSNLNTVHFTLNGEEKTIRANWVVDAMGRRRYLQTKLGLKKESPHSASSVWFRMKGKITVDDLVPKSNKAWHSRNLEDRFYSTNHLMGLGYWVWLIPLSSGNTSIGIVTQNDLHDFAAYSRSYETSCDWLERHEPHLAKHLQGREPIDFRKIKNYSYGSEKLFSENGWSCVGEAGIFSDPFYSPGSDMIAITNTFTGNLIREDIKQELSSEKVGHLNEFILGTMFPDQLRYYVNGYHTFGNTQVAASKFLWDTIYYWRVYAHAFMTGVFSDFEKLAVFEKYVKQFSKLNQSLQDEFRSLAEKPFDETFEHVDLARKKTFIESAIHLLTRPSEEDFEKHLQHQLLYLEKLKASLQEELQPANHSKSFSPFAEFFGKLGNTANFKNKYNRFVAGIGRGAFLYAVRDAYVRIAVRSRKRVHFASLLRILYPD